MHNAHVLFIILVLLAMSIKPTAAGDTDSALRARAIKIAHEAIILDGHVDVPYRLEEELDDISQATEKGEFDYPRAKQGGLDAPFMSIYIPARLQKEAGASKKCAEGLIARMDSIIAANPDKFAKAGAPADVRRNFSKGLISLPYGMENGSGIEDDLANVETFYNKGVRYITLTHSKMNLICDSSYDEHRGWNGLSPFGRKVVAEMNRLGIMVDISHVSDSTFYQVLRLSKTPVICSHSSARHFTPGFERNVNDDMLRKLAENGGVIQITFGSGFLTADANGYSKKYYAHRAAFMEHNGITNERDPQVESEMKKYKKESPYPYASVSDVVDHIEHVARTVGIDHVGIGSDFEGVGDSLPIGLKSVADYPNIVAELLKRGYSGKDIKKVLGENVLRVWQKVTEFAARQD